MAAVVHFLAAFIHLRQAFCFLAHVFECRHSAYGLTLHFVPAESALAGIFILLYFLTIHTNMVRGSAAGGAEVILTLAAAHAEVCHVFGCFFSNVVALIVFLLVVGLGGLEGDNTRTVTLYEFGVVGNSYVHLGVHNLFQDVWA